MITIQTCFAEKLMKKCKIHNAVIGVNGRYIKLMVTSVSEDVSVSEADHQFN